jgi:hypothetical protein
MEALASVECAGCEWERQPQAFRWFPELGTPLRASSRPPAHRVDDVGRCQADRERRDSGRARPVERRGTLRAHNHTPSGSSTAATSSRKTVMSGTRYTRTTAPVTTPGSVAVTSRRASGPPSCPCAR